MKNNKNTTPSAVQRADYAAFKAPQAPASFTAASPPTEPLKRAVLASGVTAIQPRPVLASKRGWHASTGIAPKHGLGTATVCPLRDRHGINTIKGALTLKPRDYALFVLGIHIGLRGGDLLALRWRDVMDGAGSISRKFAVTESKTKKLRTLALSDAPREALEKWRTVTAPSPDNYVFPNPRGQRLTIQRLHQLVNDWARAAGIEGHFGSHTLRKTYGYHLRQRGVGIEILMKIFGHSSQSITLRYLGIEQDEIDEANLKLSL